MSNRHQIKDDRQFWERLEYAASHWLQSSGDATLRRFWIDGFLPEAAKNTQRGVDVEGAAWVGLGQRRQLQYRFVVSVPQKLLHQRETFAVEHLALDEAQQTLQIAVSSESPVA